MLKIQKLSEAEQKDVLNTLRFKKIDDQSLEKPEKEKEDDEPGLYDIEDDGPEI